MGDSASDRLPSESLGVAYVLKTFRNNLCVCKEYFDDLQQAFLELHKKPIIDDYESYVLCSEDDSIVFGYNNLNDNRLLVKVLCQKYLTVLDCKEITYN